LIGFEFKYTDAPKMIPSMRLSVGDLGVNRLNVIYLGEVSYPLSHNIYVYGLKSYLNQAKEEK
jgi:hypothetical protein